MANLGTSPRDDGITRITQTAEFRPEGLLGRFYWFGVAPFHRFVFPGLLAGIIADAENQGHQRQADAKLRPHS